tara:strand:- start:876 stop:1217 length:342 start_codon:yes stop_codon:yes gene_type:complete
MNSDNIDYNPQHAGWVERVNKELGARKGYIEKTFAGDAWLNTNLKTKGNLPSSYPAPFNHLGLDHRMNKTRMGFISDGTATKLGDPGSMRDAGHGRNAVYVINAGSVPTLTKH